MDVCRFGDDLVTDTGPFLAPATYRELFKPRHTQLCEYVHKNSQMKTFLHSCWSIYSLLPDLIECGFDVINPVQTACYQMEPERLKAEFGKDITFWGGGFVFNPIHDILADVPPENIVAMFEAVAEYGTSK